MSETSLLSFLASFSGFDDSASLDMPRQISWFDFESKISITRVPISVTSTLVVETLADMKRRRETLDRRLMFMDTPVCPVSGHPGWKATTVVSGLCEKQ